MACWHQRRPQPRSGGSWKAVGRGGRGPGRLGCPRPWPTWVACWPGFVPWTASPAIPSSSPAALQVACGWPAGGSGLPPPPGSAGLAGPGPAGSPVSPPARADPGASAAPGPHPCKQRLPSRGHLPVLRVPLPSHRRRLLLPPRALCPSQTCWADITPPPRARGPSRPIAPELKPEVPFMRPAGVGWSAVAVERLAPRHGRDPVACRGLGRG